MRNAKKTLSLVMVAIFTTFIVLSGIPTSAAVKKTSKAKVTAAAKKAAAAKLAAAKKAAALKAAKLAAAKLAAAKTAAALVTAADKAVTKAEALTNGDTYDLVGNDTDLSNAQTAITNALEAVVKLNKDSSAYKGYMARIDAANKNVVDAMDQRDADAQAKLDAANEVAAEATADKAVAAVEAAPLATAADLAAAKDLGTTAATAVAAVKDATKVADYTARLKAVADKGLALQAKLDKDAADAALAAAQALLPAKIVTVSAVDGTITVTFDKKPLTTVSAADFTVTKVVTTGSAVTSTVTPTSVTVTSDTAVTIAVPAVAAIDASAQAVAYSVAYSTGAAVTVAAPYTVAVNPALTVSSVKVLNLKQIQVVFNRPIDNTQTLDNSKFLLYDNGSITNGLGTAAGVPAQSISLAADNKTVTITLGDTGAPIANLTNGAVDKLNVTGVLDANDKVMADYSNANVAVAVTSVTSAVSASITAPNTIRVLFTEPVKYVLPTTLNAAFKVDNGAYYVVTATSVPSANAVDLVLGTNITTGAHTVVINPTTGTGVQSLTGVYAFNQTLNVTYAADLSLPTATVTSTQNVATFTFSKPVTGFNNATVRYGFNTSVAAYTGAAAVATSPSNGYSTTWTVTFPTPLPAGTAPFFVTNSTTTPTTDVWGNKLADANYTATIVVDNTKPVATVTSVSNTQFKVAFSKIVDVTAGTYGALNPANYTVKDPSGTAQTISSVTLIDSQDVYINVPVLNGGSYTVTVANIEDSAPIANFMNSTAQLVAVTDSVPPVVSSFIYGVSGSGAVLKVTFSEAMTAAKLADKTNYAYSVNNGAGYNPLGSSDTVVPAADGKSVTINIATVTMNATPANNLIKFATLTDLAGNTLATVAGGVYTAYPVGGVSKTATIDGVTVVSAKAISTTQISVTLSQPVNSAVAGDFKFVDNTGAAFATPISANISSVVPSTDANGNAIGVVTFTLNGSLNADGTYGAGHGTVYVQTIASPVSETTSLGGALAAVNTAGHIVTNDAIAPTVSAVNFINSTEIDVTFTEALLPGSFATAGLNGFTVTGTNSEAISATALINGNKTVELTGTGFTAASLVHYNSVAGVTDAVGNALATYNSAGTLTMLPGMSSISATVATTGAFVAGDKITIVFNEPVALAGIIIANMTITGGHTFGTTATVTNPSGDLKTYVITAGGTGINIAAGDTITFPAANVQDNTTPANIPLHTVVFTVPTF
jgi:hypothetical protein